MESGSPWVTPSLLKIKTAGLPLPWSTSTALVFVAVEYKPGPGQPLVLIERVGRIDEQESPIFLLFVQIPEGLHRMYASAFFTSRERCKTTIWKTTNRSAFIFQA
jgi:hypothetical protein